jgi:hypothetical protein
MKKINNKYSSTALIIAVLWLLGAVLFWYWDHLDPAEFVNEMGGLIIATPIIIGFYAIVALLKKRGVKLPSNFFGKLLNRYNWVWPIVIIVVSIAFIFPALTNLILNTYGKTTEAEVTERYYIYNRAPIGFNSVFAGAKKTDRSDAITEVIKYTIPETSAHSTTDFPFDGASPDNPQMVADNVITNQHIIRVRYLKTLPFINRVEL